MPCAICLDKVPDTIGTKCGHKSMCKGCAIQYIQQKGTLTPECPTCRKKRSHHQNFR